MHVDTFFGAFSSGRLENKVLRPRFLNSAVFQNHFKMAGGQERTLARRTLICLLQAVQGFSTTVELRNESSIEGIIHHVDGFMNITMNEVRFTKPDGDVLEFPTMFVHGRQIRFVHIPDEIDMRSAIEQQLMQGVQAARSRPIGK